jgi:EF-P beta-lysylation protein EpmB
MIHRTASSWQSNLDEKDDPALISTHQLDCIRWQQHLQQAITDPEELIHVLKLDPKYTHAAIAASQKFPLKVPRPLLNRIEQGNINDPILRQILPLAEELQPATGFSIDPVGEHNGQPTGMIHKYHGRVLLMVNGHCAVNCRYCFRRHYPYEDNRLSRSEWASAIDQIRHDHTISEVIYSGGDPLASNDKQLLWLTEQIADIPHIQRLRIHTRLPVVIPNRITDDTLHWMSHTRLSCVMVLHINHANELHDQTLLQSIHTMKSAGITLLNQSVLLNGINDTSDALIELSEALFAAGILPYYLHVLDKVAGSAHFDHDDRTAKQLHEHITTRLPGYLVPKLVREIAHQPSKTAL